MWSALTCVGPNGRGYVATRPAFGPLLIWSPALKRWGPPRRQQLCRPGGLQRFRAGDKMRSGPNVGLVATSPFPYGEGPLRFREGDKISTGPNVDLVDNNPCRLGVPNASERGTKSTVAHKGTWWLYNLFRMGRVPYAAERGTKSAVAQMLTSWVHNPCRLGGPQRFRAGDKISSGPQLDVGSHQTQHTLLAG